MPGPISGAGKSAPTSKTQGKAAGIRAQQPHVKNLGVATTPILSPLSFSPTTSSSQTQSKLLILNSTEEIEAMSCEYARSAKTAGERFVSVNLTQFEQIESLTQTYSLDVASGKIQVRDGPLWQVLKEGGTIVINYDTANPNIAESFNSLFDNPPFFQGKPVNPPNGSLQIIGVMTQKTVKARKFSGAFFSRFCEKECLSTSPDKCRPSPVQLIKASKEAGGIDLRGGKEWESILLGSIDREINGQRIFREGFLKADKATYILRNANWNDPIFLAFITQATINEAIMVNGQKVEIPGLQFLKGPDYTEADIKTALENKTVVPDPHLKDHTYLPINTYNFEQFFGVPGLLDNGNLILKPGLLGHLGDNEVIRVTSALTKEQWIRLLHHPQRFKIMVDSDVGIPAAYRSFLKTTQEAPLSQETASFPLKNTHQLIYSGDVELTAEKIKRSLITEEIYDVSPDSQIDSLLVGFPRKPSSDKRTVEEHTIR